MMCVIHKFPLEIGRTEIPLPFSSEVLGVMVQRDIPVLYVRKPVPDGKHRTVTRVFDIITTGQAFESDEYDRYFGTFLLDDGRFVGHVYELRTE
jgi:hypothetical protein